MKQIEIMEKVLKKEIPYSKNVNFTFFNAYRNTRRHEQENLNFDDVIWDEDIPEIVAHCKEYGIEYITISSVFSGMIDVLEKFNAAGCSICGFCKVDFFYGGTKTAIKLQMPR
jgi:hypothetical protein